MHWSCRSSRFLVAVLVGIAIAVVCSAVEAATPEPTTTADATGISVTGIADVTNVSGVNPIDVAVTNGKATQVQLLVDDKLELSTSTTPFRVLWDTTKESPGIHTVTLRITSATGATIDKKFVVEVVLLTPTVAPTAAPTVSTNAAATGPTVTAVAGPVSATVARPGVAAYAAAIVGLVLVVGGIIAALFVLTRRRSAITPPPAPFPSAAPRAIDHTLVIAPSKIVAPVDAEGTMVVGGLADGKTPVGIPKIPRARLRIVQQGVETSIILSQPETILGREATNPVIVRDPQASRKHARILIEGGDFWYEDLKSLNGSRINDEVVVGRQKLSADDRITIGEAVLTFTTE